MWPSRSPDRRMFSVPPMTQSPPREDVTVKSAPVKYDTADAIKAFEQVRTGHNRGKIVLDMCK